MGLFSGWRHHLQNEANREIMRSAREKRAAQRRAAEAKRQRDVRIGGFILANTTQAARAADLDGMAERTAQRGHAKFSADCRNAAEAIRRMTPEEYAEHQAALLRDDPSTSITSLAARIT